MTTNYLLNELLSEIRVNDILDLLQTLSKNQLIKLQNVKQQKAENAIAFTAVASKIQYNHKHKPIAMRDQIFLKLHSEYSVSELQNHKLVS